MNQVELAGSFRPRSSTRQVCNDQRSHQSERMNLATKRRKQSFYCVQKGEANIRDLLREGVENAYKIKEKGGRIQRSGE
jgi:hypothetical protein